MIPVIFGGIVLLCFLTLFPFQRKIHGKLSKYFLTNMFRIPGSLPLTCLLYSAKPILLSSIQALSYDSPSVQLCLLGMTELAALFLMWGYQQKHGLFISKKLFCIECMMSAVMALLNLCLSIKLLYLPE